MPAGNQDLKANDDNYFKIDNSALGATWQVSKKDSVKIGKVQPPDLADEFHSPHNILAPKLAVLIPSTQHDLAIPSSSPHSTLGGTSPRLLVTGTRPHSTGPWRTGGRLWRGL